MSNPPGLLIFKILITCSQRQQQEADIIRLSDDSKALETAILNAIRKSAASLGQDFAAFSATMQKSSEAQLRTVMNIC